MTVDDLANFRERGLTIGAVEERHTNLVLELFDRLANSGLGGENLRRRPGKSFCRTTSTNARNA
jgi:hypothetical protein